MVPATPKAKAPKTKGPATVKVKVAGNWQVSHDGNVWEQGQTATIPVDLADEWERAALVTRI